MICKCVLKSEIFPRFLPFLERFSGKNINETSFCFQSIVVLFLKDNN